MKQYIVRRVLPILLSVSLILPSLSLSVFAAGRGDQAVNIMYDAETKQLWDLQAKSLAASLADAVTETLQLGSVVSGLENKAFWLLVDAGVGGVVGEVEYDHLVQLAEKYNSAFNVNMENSFLLSLFKNTVALAGSTFAEALGLGGMYFTVQKDGDVWRIKDTGCTNLFVVDSSARFPYAWVDEDDSEVIPAVGDHWVPGREIYPTIVAGMKETPPKFPGHHKSYSALQAIMYYRITQGDICSLQLIPGSDGRYGINSNGTGEWWCASDGLPYYAVKDEQAAVEYDRPTTDIEAEGDADPIEPEEGDPPVGIDIDGMVVYLPGGVIQPILYVDYDPSSYTYNVTTYDVTDYNITYNYTYKYYLQYTYVTYIGETSDYEAYKCYYELPDGRNSADLTKEELEQLSVAIDVVEYSRATDDVRVRALYHFDGSTKDSSYWNHQSKFDWSNTPSITYMDVETFNGALYLDGNVRSTLNMSLPTDLGRGDFTIQFRYYQGQKIEDDAYTGLYLNADFLDDEWSPRTDEDAHQILSFNGSSIGSSFIEIFKTENYPIGSWFEVCITRQGNVLTYYLNGMPVEIETISSAVFDKTLTFHFDGGTVAYAMIDELRVLNYAIASGEGSYYEPTAVPHDTNLALVLPEDKVAIADEYWEITSSGKNLLKERGLDDWTTQWIDTSNALVPLDHNVYNVNGNWNFDLDPKNLISDDLIAYYNTDVIDLDFSSSGTMFDLVYDRPQDYEHLSLAGGFMSFSSGYSVPFSSIYIPISIGGNSVLADDSYVFSVVNGSGAIRTIKFTIKDGLVQTGTSATFGNMRISASRIGSGSNIVSYICIGFNPKTDKVPTQPIVYMELAKGTSTDLKAEFHEDVAILDKDDQFKPTLSVRTDLEITDYQIGGVRPAIPSKGLVYALVQSGYITSLQIYNGQAWEAVDGRIWTGERWIPYSSYNIITLQDMYDISDTTNDYEYIYTETGFWSWWQRSWNEFTGKLFGLLGGGAGDVDLDEPVTESDPENEDDLSFWEFIKLLLNGCKAVFTGARQLFGGVVSTVPEAVSTLTGAFEPGGMAVSFLDGSDPDADAAELRIVSYTIPDDVYNEGDPFEYSIQATGIGLTYQWLTSTDNKDFHVFATKPSFTSSAWGYGHYNVFVKCVVTDYKGNQLSTPVIVHSVEAASTYSLRGFRDVDPNEYYETEVLDPWRYR